MSYCSQGAHSRISCSIFLSFLLARCRGVLLVLVKLECVFLSDFPACLEYTFWSDFPACLEHTIYRWCPSRFTLHSFSSKRSEFLEYTSFLCFCLSSYFLVENKIKATFSLISVGRSIKGRLKSSVGMSRVPIFFLMRCVGSYHAADDTM